LQYLRHASKARLSLRLRVAILVFTRTDTDDKAGRQAHSDTGCAESATTGRDTENNDRVFRHQAWPARRDTRHNQAGIGRSRHGKRVGESGQGGRAASFLAPARTGQARNARAGDHSPNRDLVVDAAKHACCAITGGESPITSPAADQANACADQAHGGAE
jgi:hypothetical protein